MPAEISEDTVDKLRQAYEAGFTARQAAIRVGVCSTTGIRYFHRFRSGGHKRANIREGCKLRPDKVSKLRDCYCNGTTLRSAALMAGCSETTVGTYFKYFKSEGLIREKPLRPNGLPAYTGPEWIG